MGAAIGLAAAVATMRRGAGFLIDAGAGAGAARSGHVEAMLGMRDRGKVAGNALRELDRFLSVIIDEVARELALSVADRAGLARQRNTPNKLRVLRRALDLPSPDHERLRAIGRLSACLFHCAGVVRRADTRGGSGMVRSWADGGAAPAAMGEELPLSAAELRDIARFYVALTAELVAGLQGAASETSARGPVRRASAASAGAAPHRS